MRGRLPASALTPTVHSLSTSCAKCRSAPAASWWSACCFDFRRGHPGCSSRWRWARRLVFAGSRLVRHGESACPHAVEQAGCGLVVPLALFTGSLAILSGALIGIVLGMIGGGGSILAVPLLVYVVGVPSIHVAIGTAAIAVAINAAFGLAGHARIGAVKWPCALVFAGAGSFGALAGSALGKATGADELLALFGGLLIVVGFLMLASPSRATPPDVRLSTSTAGHLLPRLLAVGTGVGLLSGYFGIGGGFLIVPGLMLATAMPLRNAVATSLVAVTAFGLTTAGSYASFRPHRLEARALLRHWRRGRELHRHSRRSDAWKGQARPDGRLCRVCRACRRVCGRHRRSGRDARLISRFNPDRENPTLRRGHSRRR